MHQLLLGKFLINATVQVAEITAAAAAAEISDHLDL
jgi:hypothetical protein